MRVRKTTLGERNIIGAYVNKRRKAIGLKQKDLLTQLQIMGIDLNASGLSKIEGQQRFVTDFELKALAEALGCTILDMFSEELQEEGG
ncbi:MAG: XRE family transcriptional regulator [Oscillospiraceae bacterium]|nr:XRE family transcriptional regulator [Oscillospiraceae bacterium]